MFTIESRSIVPIFQQIIDQVGRFIALGVLKPNDQLPPVRALARELGINPNTVSKAYQECESLKLTYSIPGKGSYIASELTGIGNVLDSAYNTFFDQLFHLIELGETRESIQNRIKEKIDDTTYKC